MSVDHPAHGGVVSFPAETPDAGDAALQAEEARKPGAHVLPGQLYHRNFDLLCALGFSGCMVAFMIVLALPFFRSASPSASGRSGDVYEVHILPSNGAPTPTSQPTPQHSPTEEKTATAGTTATPAAAVVPPTALAQHAPTEQAQQGGTVSPGVTTEDSVVSSAMDAVASAKATAERSASAAFQDALYDRLGRYQIYPKEASQQQLQGLVLVTFVMDRDGTVLNVSVKRTSGETILDKAAVETILKAQPLPRIPPQLPGHLTVQVPIAYPASSPQSAD
jgi:protein TonB